MLRTTSNSLFAKTSTIWKSPAIYSTIKTYTTTNSATTPAAANTSEKKKDISLSARLGGSGRGKVITEGGASSSDPFASFLANAKKPRTQNNNRNGSFTPRPRKQQGDNNGQFADAATTTVNENSNKKPRQPRTQRAEGATNNNNNRSRSQQGGQRKTEGGELAAQQTQGNRRQPRTNNNRNRENKQGSDGSQQQQQPRRRLNLNRSQQPQEVRTRRATTFIDKDIDWSSFTLEETSSVGAAEEQQQQQQQTENAELLSKDIQGDYTRYLSVGSDIKWSQLMNGTNVGTLVGSNPTFDLSQKTAFLAALSSATATNAAAARK